jgi:hypothetical protein
VTPVRAVASVGIGTALLSVLSGCSADALDNSLGTSSPISVASDSAVLEPTNEGSGPKQTAAAAAGTLFGGSAPVSIAYWWDEHPEAAPADLGQRKLLFNQKGTGPQRFPGPDVRKYKRILMVITCSKKSEYLVRLQVLDGLSIVSTEGTSCGGPTLSAYASPLLDVTDKKTEVEVQVPEGAKYYVTFYGTPKQ